MVKRAQAQHWQEDSATSIQHSELLTRLPSQCHTSAVVVGNGVNLTSNAETTFDLTIHFVPGTMQTGSA